MKEARHKRRQNYRDTKLVALEGKEKSEWGVTAKKVKPFIFAIIKVLYI